MTISVVGTDGAGNSSTGTLSMTYPSGIASGDIILALVSVNGSTGGNTASTPANYTALDTYAQSSTGDLGYVFGKIASGSESGSLSVTINGSNRRSAGFLRVFHGNGTGFSATLGNNFSSFIHDDTGATSQAAITTTALTSVPSGAWLLAVNTAGVSSATKTCAVTGTHWTEFSAGEQQVASGGFLIRTDAADNSTDTGTANTCTFTWSGNHNQQATSFYIFEQAGSSFVLNPLFGPLGRTRFVG